MSSDSNKKEQIGKLKKAVKLEQRRLVVLKAVLSEVRSIKQKKSLRLDEKRLNELDSILNQNE